MFSRNLLQRFGICNKSKEFIKIKSRFYWISVTGKELRILGIESSCDDSAAAVVTSSGNILSHVVKSQNSIHAEYGGIVPIVATEHHTSNMPFVIKEALAKSGTSITDLDAIAVTRGPGLPSSLAVGLNAAKTLAAVHDKPLIGVHHMEAHALVARLGNPSVAEFPFLCLLISGGHTMLVVVNDINSHTILGTTLDESIGNCFDKVSRHLLIPKSDSKIPFGECLEITAKSGNPARFDLPVPLSKSDSANSLDYSFTGLKSFITRYIDEKKLDVSNPVDVADMAASFQYTATKHLISKVKKGYKKVVSSGIPVKSFVVSGGAARNNYIRDQLELFCRENNLKLALPPHFLCSDNGVMIAWAGIERFNRGLFDDYGISIKQRWPLDQLGKSE
ncbi:hypothetical protein BB560_003628 [Smittium megazygosporum]|uniref:N(6)-L-threonylcarbamoyladenine synthase n=1 Tax=Smittium megazygosporum TaxID=133381 RepID=A0A2T9ZBH9_9FUNG|nr:hypothetical protein BB560_003628 [Smittium megazygosporum]